VWGVRCHAYAVGTGVAGTRLTLTRARAGLAEAVPLRPLWCFALLLSSESLLRAMLTCGGEAGGGGGADQGLRLPAPGAWVWQQQQKLLAALSSPRALAMLPASSASPPLHISVLLISPKTQWFYEFVPRELKPTNMERRPVPVTLAIRLVTDTSFSACGISTISEQHACDSTLINWSVQYERARDASKCNSLDTRACSTEPKQ
jgi:hypothetical protein